MPCALHATASLPHADSGRGLQAGGGVSKHKPQAPVGEARVMVGGGRKGLLLGVSRAICPEERTFSGQVSEAGWWPPSLPVLSFILEKRRCWGRREVGRRALNWVGDAGGSSCHKAV